MIIPDYGFGNHCFFSICGRGLDGVDLLVLFAVIFLFLGSESGGDFAVEGGEFRFEFITVR